MRQLSAFQLLHRPYHKNGLQWKKYEASLVFITPSDISPIYVCTPVVAFQVQHCFILVPV